jgi:phenylpropionate dioxygenase-like ring-hydroxylating dioxygenase large terminal subunit
MLSKQQNELICKVGPGTPMGEVMRQYWIPALVSNELAEPDGRPARLRLLGEDLVAFRDTSGRVGIMAHNCPHRGASLFFGRNEDEGLRCVYHGWKFDVSGRCVDMPNEPPESNFKDKVRAIAYPTQERGGVVWVYMGRRETPPPLSTLEPNMAADGIVTPVMRDCNWLQGLEGDIDTSHLGFLHLGSMKPEQLKPGTFDYYTVKDRAPRYEVIDTDFGTMYGAYRPAEEDTNYWRIAAFLFPFYTMIPTGVLGLKVGVRAWVPIDDDRTMFWNMYTPAQRYGLENRRQVAGGGRDPGVYMPADQYLPNSSDFLGRWRLKANASNDYLLDAEAQKTQSFTGIAGIHIQDQAITESMGTLLDRTVEHLGTADVMIIRTRQRLTKAVEALQAEGSVPPGVDDPDVFAVRTGSVFLPKGADWLEETEDLRKAFVEHPDLLQQAEAGRF